MKCYACFEHYTGNGTPFNEEMIIVRPHHTSGFKQGIYHLCHHCGRLYKTVITTLMKCPGTFVEGVEYVSYFTGFEDFKKNFIPIEETIALSSGSRCSSLNPIRCERYERHDG